MTTVVGTFTLPSNDAEGAPIPDSGTVRFSLAASAVLQDAPPQIVTTADVVVTLDDEGSFSVELLPSDSPLWATEDPVPYVVTRTLSTTRDRYSVLVPTSGSAVDLSTLLPLGSPPDVVVVPGPAPVITEGEFTAVPVAPGGVPTVDVTFTPGDPGEYEVSGEFGLVAGAPGQDAAEPVFSATATEVAPGGSPTATISGTYPALSLDFGLVTGDKGDTGSLAYWWRGAWASGPYVEGDVVTNDGSLWLCVADNTGLEPGAAPVTVAVGGAVGSSSSSSGTAERFQSFTATTDRWITHVTQQAGSPDRATSLRDSTGAVLASFTTGGGGVMVTLSNPVQLLAGQTYYLGLYGSTTYGAASLSGIVGALPGPLRTGTWDGVEAAGRYGGFTLHGDSVESWVPLAEKGDKGDTGATGPAGATAAALTTKGDLLSHDGGNGVRLPAGPEGRVLQPDPSATSGVAWTPLGNAVSVCAATGGDQGGLPENAAPRIRASGGVGGGTAIPVTVTSNGARSGSCLTMTTLTGTNWFFPVGAFAVGDAPAKPGRTYTFAAWVLTTPNEAWEMRLRFYTAAGATIIASSVNWGAFPAQVDPVWRLRTMVFTAPADTVTMGHHIYRASGAASVSPKFDGITIHEGVGGQIGFPGRPVSDLGTVLGEDAPENTVYAPVGTVYRQTTGRGFKWWRKTSGAAATGWVEFETTESTDEVTAAQDTTRYDQTWVVATGSTTTIVLDHPPLAGSVTVVKEGLIQPATAWSLSHRTVTLTGTTSGDDVGVTYSHDTDVPSRIPAIISNPIVSDTFTRAASASTMGSTDTGQTWTPNQSSVWGITAGGKAYRATPGAGILDRVTVDAGASDVEVDVTIESYAWGAGLIVRNLWVLTHIGLGRSGGSLISSYRLGNLTAGNTYRFRFRADGETLSVFRWVTDHWELDIGPLGGFTDNITSTVHGLYQSWASGSGQFDNFTIRSV